MNNEQFIKQLIAEGEGHQVEFKTGVNIHDIGKTICGFLNAAGGQLLLGVANDGTAVGISDTAKTKQEIEAFLMKEILPDAPIMVSEESFKSKRLVLVKVWAGSKQPYIFDGSIFYRTEQNTVKATSEEISKLIHNRQSMELHWERQPAFGVDDDDIDFDEIKKTIHDASKVNKRQDFNFEPVGFLEYYGLFKNGNFTNAAVVLFAKNPARFIPQSRVRLAFLPEGKTGDIYHDDQLLEGNLFDNIRSILSFLDKHLPTRRSFNNEEWHRKDDSVFPVPALREGILNALVHRSYASYNDSMSIILYGDRLEITNSGTSPLKVTELRRNHLSMPVNPDIAHILFLRGYIEKLGRGTLKIIDMFKEAELKAPSWKIDNNSVKLTFLSNINLVPSRGSEVDGTNEGTIKGNVEGTNKRTIEGTIEGIVKGTIEGSTDQVVEKVVVVLEAIASNEGKRVPDYQEYTGIAPGSLERYIRLLRDAKLIEFKGDSLQTGGYFTTKLFSRKLKK